VHQQRKRLHQVGKHTKFFTIGSALVLGSSLLAAGCEDDRDPRFRAETFDEYTQPLTNAVIGTPTGTVTIDAVGADGGVTGPGGATGAVDAGAPRPDARPGIGGQIGAAGAPGRGLGGRPGSVDAGAGVGGAGGTGGASDGSTPGRGQWHFDDCSPSSHFLIDSSGFGANAQQALNAACVPGIAGQGVQIRTAKDIIQIPDQPQFTVSRRVAVAAWVHPDTVAGDQPIVIKRLNNQTSFSLGIHNGNIEMSVVLTTGKTFISRAPIAPGVWTHVGGMYDGTFVFLFINGQQFGQVFAGANLRNVFAPIRIGATTQSQSFHGIIDEVFLSTEEISKDVITALACITRPSTLSIDPVASGPVPIGTPFHYDVLVTDNDVGSCAPRSYQAFFQFFDPNIQTSFETSNFQSASPGQTVNFGVSLTASDNAEPGPHQIPISVFSFSQFFESLQGTLNFEVQLPPCFVNKKRELMITDVNVVNDPVRANGQFLAPSSGAWTFGHLMREMAPTPADAPAMAQRLFETWLTDQTVNGFRIAARPAAQQQILDIWPRTPTGELDLDRSPFQLQAIVSRIDLRDVSAGSAGQGRFVFALTDAGGFFGQEFTVIMEFNLPATTDQEVIDWANRWHALASHPFPSEEYNAALEQITRSFSDRNAGPGRVNGSNLLQLRTNDFLLSFFSRWELREFELSADTGFLQPSTVKETPDLSFNNTQTLADFTNQNEAAIISVIPGAPSTTVPREFQGSPFLAGSIFNDGIGWNSFGIRNPEARFHVSLNTCNGCHGPETNTGFLMIFPRSFGQEAGLSQFLTGTSVFDRFTGQIRNLNDLSRRATDLSALLCSQPAATPAALLK